MYEDLETLLAEQGARKTDLLFYSIYLREMRNFPVLARTRAAIFESGVAPPSTASQVPGLLFPGALVYFDPVALIPDPANGHTKEVLASKHVVQGPLSNYELASRAGDYTFYAGVVGAHPETGLIIYGANELSDADWPRPCGGLAAQMMLEPISAQTTPSISCFAACWQNTEPGSKACCGSTYIFGICASCRKQNGLEATSCRQKCPPAR